MERADTLVVLELAQALISIFIHSTNMYGVTTLYHTLFKMLVIYTGNKPDKSPHLSKNYIIVRGKREKTYFVISCRY